MEYLIVKKENHVATITLNRPKALNAFCSAMHTEMQEALAEAAADSVTNVILINSSIEKAFTAGGDLKEEQKLTADTAADFSRNGLKTIRAIRQCKIPVISVVDGYALGAGMEIILASDFTFITPEAKVGMPSVRLGSVTAWGGTQLLARTVGYSRAMEILLTGRNLSGQECYDLGLAEYLVSKENLQSKAREIAEQIADCPPVSIYNFKRGIRDGQEMTLEESYELESELFAECYRSEDRQEALAAFFEKRPHKPYKGI